MSGTTKKSTTARKAPAARAATAKKAATKVSKPVAKKSVAKKVAPKKVVNASNKVAAKRTVKKAAKATVHAAPIAAPAVHHHAPQRPTTYPKVNEAWLWVSYFLTFLFVYSVTEKVADAKVGVTGSPMWYAFIPALVLALVVWRTNRTKNTYTGMIIVVTILAVAAFIWMFGVTNADGLLFGS